MKIPLKRRTIQYPPEFDQEFKNRILERDKHICVCCKTPNPKLDVHHIDYTKHTIPENCISVCRNCHTQIHYCSWYEKQILKYRLWKIASERERECRQAAVA